MIIKTALLKHRTKKLNNPQYVKNRIFNKIAESRIYYTAKNIFHFVSIFSTTMMLAFVLPEWLKAPLMNVGIDITALGEDLIYPTAVISVALSFLLEITSVKALSKLLEAIATKEDKATITFRLLAMLILTAVQLYTFVGGVQNTVRYAMAPSVYQTEIKSLKREIAFRDNDISKIAEKIEGVKNGTRAIDDVYGTGAGNLTKELKRDYLTALKAYKAYEAIEKKKKINLNADGSLKRIARALLAEKYNTMVKPLEDRYNRAKTSKKDAKKIWIENAEDDIKRVKALKSELTSKLQQLETEYNQKLQQAEKFMPKHYYWLAGIILMIGLSAMDYLHRKAYDEALKRFDNAKNSDKNKERTTSDFNPDIYLTDTTVHEIKDDQIDSDFDQSHASSFDAEYREEDNKAIDNEIIDYMRKVYSRVGELPSVRELQNALNLHPTTISSFYKRNEDLFIKRNGAKVQPSESFLYILDEPFQSDSQPFQTDSNRFTTVSKIS
jgi:hypothetical protein